MNTRPKTVPKLREKESYLQDLKEKSIELVNKIKQDLKDDQVNHQYWDALRTNNEIFKLRFTSANFENKLLDMIYDFKLENKELLDSLRSYFLYRKIDKSLIQKCTYGQLLLMLNDPKYDDEIERIYTKLKDDNILTERVCTNFLITYSRSSPERFARCFDYLDKENFKNIEIDKQIEFMNVALEHDDQDRFVNMCRLFAFRETILRDVFLSERSHPFKKEANFLKLLKAINDAAYTLQTNEIDYVRERMQQFGYQANLVAPKDLTCPNCTARIPTLEDDELETLKEYFETTFFAQVERILNPKSKSFLYEFVKFLARQKDQFDLIIDGMNMSFQGSINFYMSKKENRGGIDLYTTKDHLDLNLVNTLDTIVKSGHYKRILFIGRHSQSRYDKFGEFTAKHNIKCSFFHKEVDDDLSIILASLFNKESKIATNDFFNDYLLDIKDEKMKFLFHKFVGTRIVTFHRKNIAINYFNEGWSKTVHLNPECGSVHVPFDSECNSYKHLYNWYCFKKNSS